MEGRLLLLFMSLHPTPRRPRVTTVAITIAAIKPGLTFWVVVVPEDSCEGLCGFVLCGCALGTSDIVNVGTHGGLIAVISPELDLEIEPPITFASK